MKVRPIAVGDTITVDGDDYKVTTIGPRNQFEKINATLLGQGIMAEKDGIDYYFLDIDVDYVNGKPMLEETMKTLMMFDQCEGFGEVPAIIFIELEGDYSHLDGLWINCDENTQELFDLVFDEEGKIKAKWTKEPTKDWDKFISCGMAL